MIKIALAGLIIALDTDSADMAAFCRDYLTDSPAAPDFTVSVDDADIALERRISAQECIYEGLPIVPYTDAELTRTAFYRGIAELLPDYNAAVFHGSVVAVGEEAFCFTAKSGTGKSTHTNLWLEHIPGAYMVNGDKPILRLTEDGVKVYGTPWAGKEGLQRNVGVPLRSIVLLQRGQENRIRRMTFGQIYPMLLQQCYRPRKKGQLKKTIEFIAALGRRLAFCRLQCRIDPEAALLAYEVMRSQREGEPENEAEV